MKNPTIVFMLLTVVLVAACKKETYTCDCTLTETHKVGGSTFSKSYNSTSSPYSKKMSKAQAQSACDHEEASLVSNYKSYNDQFNAQFTAFGFPDDTTAHYSATCTLK